jgi:RNase P/RNase MRP subunit p30
MFVDFLISWFEAIHEIHENLDTANKIKFTVICVILSYNTNKQHNKHNHIMEPKMDISIIELYVFSYPNIRAFND